MSLYSLKKISLLAESRQAYLRGVSGYNTGWVRSFSVMQDDYGQERIIARTEEPSAAYEVEIGFDRAGEVEMTACGCHRHQVTHRACKHIVAVLTYKYYQDMTCAQPVSEAPAVAIATDAAARTMMDRYLSAERVRLTAAEEKEEEVRLVPVLNVSGATPTVSFSVGWGKLYRIKNLMRFAEAMEQGDTTEYGRHLTLIHHRDRFAAESRPLLDFLLTELRDTPAHTGTVPSGGVGELRLTRGGLDRFVSRMLGGPLTLLDAAGEHRVTVEEGHPTLTVTVERDGDGLRLFGDESRPLYGANRLYLVHRGCLYRTDREYTRRMEEWVRTMARMPQGLYFAPDELPAFCGGMLRGMRPHLVLRGEAAALEAYVPPLLHTEIRLDRTDYGTVTARVDFVYGGRVASYDGDTQPWQDPLAELPVRMVLDRYFAGRLEDGTLTAEWEDDRLYEFLTEGLPRLRQLTQVSVSAAFDRRGLASVNAPVLRVSLVEDLLRMEIDWNELDPVELSGILTGYREARPYHRLRDGRLLPLTQGALAGLYELAEGFDLTAAQLSGQVTLPVYRAMYLDSVLKRQSMTVQRDRWFDRLIRRHGMTDQAEYPIPASLGGVLRGYQRIGYRWLRRMDEMGFGGILADDMGLGKTLQMITLMLDAKERGITTPSLVVCPTSVVLGWEREIARFAPQLRVLCVIGDAQERRRRLTMVQDYDVVVTSYDMLKRDVVSYGDLTFHYHILDEAQYIKNSATQNARAVKTIRSARRFALTGTPVENRLGELWSIFDFLMPGLLFSYPKFRHRFELPILRGEDPRAVERLGRLVSPFILRRLKRDVLTELPPKTERELPATMERAQRQVYLSAVAELRRQITHGGVTGRQRITVLSQLTRLRQICCDPRLCCEGYTGESCKLEACVELLKEATAAGHKVLLFSQFTSMLALIRARLEQESIGHYVLQGSTSKEERARLVDTFNEDDTPVFLISLKAGGVGLNLTGADMVIHYDPWWNVSVENQATDRAHRIGQKNPVQVVRLVAQDTIEEKILQMQESKRQLAEQIVGTATPSIKELTAEEWLELLE